MSGLPLAHVGGIPIEEAIGAFGPALLVAFGAVVANLRARLRPRARPRMQERGAPRTPV